MENDFQEFLGFIHKFTGKRPPELEESLKNVFIYVPSDRTPPEKQNTCFNRPRISIITYLDTWNKDFRRLVYNGDWKVIESIIGYELLRFCLSECVLGIKTKNGSFMVSTLMGLEYKSANDNRRKELNKIFYKSASAIKIFAKENRDNNKSVDNNEESFDWEETQKNLIHLFSTSDIEISFDHLILKFSKSNRFQKDHFLMDKKETLSLSQEVMKTRVGNSRISGHENCLEQLEEILKEFKNNHATYNYDKSLEGLLLWNEKDSNKLKNELPISVVKTFFSHICIHVLPKTLFGSNKNVNAVIKIVCDLLDAPRSQSINLRRYMLKMKLSDIRWLNEVTNTDTQWIVIGKLLKWLFVNFIFEILRTQFYIIVMPPSNRKIYFKQLVWKKSVRSFVKKMFEDEVISKFYGLYVQGPPIGNWFLFPKKNGIRPILAPRRIRIGRMKESTRQTLHFLQQIYITKYGDFGKKVFEKRWRDFVKKYNNCDKKPLYVVSCDIEAAFESIDQRKLIEIVESYADLSQTYVTMKYYKVGKNLKKINSLPLRTKRFVSYPEFELPISEGSVFAHLPEKPLIIRKEQLLRIMRSYVLNQHVIIQNERFVLQKGIAQGAILSPILCDLYYANMIDEKLPRFRDQGFLYRYVDDFLFVTEDRTLAEEFLELIKTGFPDYNCVFTAAKTKTNLPGHENPLEDITFLGYNINLKNLEVTVNYSTDSRYTTIASKPKNDILKNFRKRMCNLAPLKLDGLVLDSNINSEDTIVNTINCAFIKQAERCLWLLKTMFDDIRKNIVAILKIIRAINLKIFRNVRQHLTASGFDFEKLVPRLAVIPWQSYRQVFGKIQSIHEHFRILFLMNIKMTKNFKNS